MPVCFSLTSSRFIYNSRSLTVLHYMFLCIDGVFRKSSAEIKMPYIPAHPISAEDAEQFLRLDNNSEDLIILK